ncbi:leucine/isoleucine/valine transporter subunit; membrane component of ABC superfamily [Methylocella tundrae]|uniref:Leucine/isoleucine/valine transporter subunit membrane component of ABC superfamily n=1 Tax=Methylocella tundrae TaxID=227605 RepID=A0A8B6MBT7_METTU|nr:high-affinity branched-chain amino acid ABC transporter permease LivM [Methylocella tundrae]VTZ51719.1 leucine/isoleucine/valine transporter subunit; membrane component of ABC superfamily [Methylocella tundrae]
MAGSDALPRSDSPSPVRAALIGAAKAAVLMFGLAFPILAYRTDLNFSNELYLQSRWPAVAVAVAAAFILRFLVLLAPRRPQRAAKLNNGPARYGALLVLARFASSAGVAALVAFPIATLAISGPAGAQKWIDNFGIQILLYVLLGWGLNIVVGLAGLLDLGYVAFYAVGAYAYALLSTTWGWSFWVCLPIAGLFAALWGIALGLPVLRLRGDYLAIVTMAFGEIIRIVLTNWTALTNGDAGISSIPRITFFGWPFVPGPHGFAALFGLKFAPVHRVIFLFYLVLAMALLVNFLSLRLRRLPIGRAFEALREDEIACRSLGIDTVATKLTAFALGAMIAGMAGALFAARQNFVSPTSFTFMESATILALVVLGGGGSQLGVALAAVGIIGGSELLRELDGLKVIFGDGFDPTQYRMLIVGVAMVAMMNWKPRGLIALRKPSIFLVKPKSVVGVLAQEGHG